MVVDGTGDVLYNPHTKNFIYNSSAAEKAHEKVLNKQAKKSSSPVTKVSNQVQKQETKNGSNAIYGKLSSNVKDFVTGVSVSVDNNVFFKGAQTITGNTVFPDTDAFKVGKVVGDAASIAIGVAGTIAGGAEVAGGIAGGIVAAPATGGASVVLGGAVAVEGVALTAAGVVVTGVSTS
ncbi:hypothetical protein, partial [Stenotrophomonas maltophilia group sp. RNC7]|uniref:hypothetical protein n=1 Tax=Stenotrophomonas maltophilia group sp. RNC7 TaxID=3071467 RepID=UPI0027E1F03A